MVKTAKNTIQGGNPLEPVHGFDGLTTGEVIQSSVLVKEGTDQPLRSHANRGLAVDPSGTFVFTGRTTIATAGSTAQLNGGSSIPCKAVMVVALPTNTSAVAIGDTNTNADAANLRGIPLDPGEKQAIDISDVNAIYLDVLGNGHGVTWTILSG